MAQGGRSPQKRAGAMRPWAALGRARIRRGPAVIEAVRHHRPQEW